MEQMTPKQHVERELRSIRAACSIAASRNTYKYISFTETDIRPLRFQEFREELTTTLIDKGIRFSLHNNLTHEGWVIRIEIKSCLEGLEGTSPREQADITLDKQRRNEAAVTQPFLSRFFHWLGDLLDDK